MWKYIQTYLSSIYIYIQANIYLYKCSEHGREVNIAMLAAAQIFTSTKAYTYIQMYERITIQL